MRVTTMFAVMTVPSVGWQDSPCGGLAVSHRCGWSFRYSSCRSRRGEYPVTDMVAGRELIAKVATIVMGWTWDDTEGAWLTPDDSYVCAGWDPLSDIADAWMVVDRIVDSDGPYYLQKWSFALEFSHVIDWVADFTPRSNHPLARQYPAFQASATTASRAIVLAALKAIGGDRT